MTNIVLQGASGRMGQAVSALVAERDDCRIIAGIDTDNSAALTFPVYSSLEDMQEKPDVLIDFSHPDATRKAIAYCASHKLAGVFCTTGLSAQILQEMKEAASSTAVFYSANMSVGINLLIQLVQKAQSVLPGFDIEIIEKHHKHKLDAPSGTALAIADAINEESGGRYTYQYNRQPLRQERPADEIGIHSVRGGTIVGEHEVLFAGPDEILTISHTALSRNVFANGALAAATYLAGKTPGMYSMQDMLA